MNDQTNIFEAAILQAISKRTPQLASWINGLKVTSREFTGVGSFAEFETDMQAEAIPCNHLGNEIQIRIPKLANGLGVVLFVENSRPKMLEVFSYEEEWDGSFAGFVIEED